MVQRAMTRSLPDDRTTAAGACSTTAEASRILSAARAVLSRSHFRSLKVRQVLIASDTSARHFYQFFPTKAHLLLAVMEDEIRLAERRLAAKISSCEAATEQLRAWVAFNIGNVYHRSRTERVRMFLSPELREELPEQTRSVHDILRAQLAGILRRGMRAGEFRHGDASVDAAMVQYLTRGIVDDGLVAPLDRDKDEIVSQACEFILRALRRSDSEAVSEK